jgi:hypothetical protein
MFFSSPKLEPPYEVLDTEFFDLFEAIEYARSLDTWVYEVATGMYIQPDLYLKGYYPNHDHHQKTTDR